ncbi:DUF6603 domain-containing protein [Microbacterium sp.]|uniref:DUF6603 domain-containing protein n=1 Tax=Microbacterium sp. TaxID=51671 RepID=UPI0032216CCB
MADVLSTLKSLFDEVLADPPPSGAPPLPAALVGLRDRLGALTGITFDGGGDPLEKWLATLRSITGDVAVRETLVVRVLQLKLPRVAESLTLLGVVTVPDAAWIPDAPAPAHFRIDWKALEALTTDPGTRALDLLLGKVTAIEDLQALQVMLLLLVGAPAELVRLEHLRKGFLALPVAARPGVDLGDLIERVNSPVRLALPPTPPVTLDDVEPGPPPAGGNWLVLDGPDAVPVPGRVGDLGMSVIIRDAAAAASWKVDVGTWQLTFVTSATGEVTLRLTFADDRLSLAGADRSTAEFAIYAGPKTPPGKDALRFGSQDGTHLSVGQIKVGVVFAAPGAGTPLFRYSLVCDPVEFSVAADLLNTIAMGLPVPKALTFVSEIATTFEQLTGLAAQGAAGGAPAFGVEFSRHLGLSIGGKGAGLWVDDLLTRLETAFSGTGVAFRVVFRFGARGELGPVKVTMDGAGVWIGRWTSGNAGVLAPTGIGISIEAGPISGGGFLKTYAPGDYGGALQLKILGIGAFAYGLYKELPGGDASIAALIGIRLPLPGIQVGFGFAIMGFGGLIGINRRADLDALRERLVSGTAGDVLFTDDPMKNAPKLLGELRTLFPDKKGTHVFGPTIKIQWLSLLRLDLGLFIELPGPSKVFIAGSGKLVLGSEDFALVHLRLDFVGGVDLAASLIFFEGYLVDSTVLGIIRITGGLALRIGYGGNPYFVYSVGGFHPEFNPGNLPMPAIPRAGAGVDLGVVWFKQEMYLAVTSNTLQFGSNTEAGVRIGPISVHGWFRFDALIQFRPFAFVATIDAGMEAAFKGWSFASIRVRGTLSGPGPLVLHASASVHVLVEISKDVTITIDRTPAESLPPMGPLSVRYRGELSDPANLRGEGTDAELVYGGGGIDPSVIVPVGTLVWEQKRVPLDLPLQRAEGQDLGGVRTLRVSVAGVADPDLGAERDSFARGTFAHLSDAEALATPSFVEARSGFRLDGAAHMQAAAAVERRIELNLVRLPERRRIAFAGLIAALPLIELGLLSESLQGAAVRPQAPAVTVGSEAWQHVDASGAVTGGSAAACLMTAKLSGGMATPAGTAAVELQEVLG